MQSLSKRENERASWQEKLRLIHDLQGGNVPEPLSLKKLKQVRESMSVNVKKPHIPGIQGNVDGPPIELNLSDGTTILMWTIGTRTGWIMIPPTLPFSVVNVTEL